MHGDWNPRGCDGLFLTPKANAKNIKKEQIWKLKRGCLSETSQHQFHIISITNQSTKKLADNHPSYLHQYTHVWCGMSFLCLPTLQAPNVTWLPSPGTEKLLLCLAPPLSSLHKASMLPQHQSGIIYCCWSSNRNLSSQPSRTSRGCPNERDSPKCFQSCQSINLGRLLPTKMMPSSLPLYSLDLLKTSLSVPSEH